MNAAVIALLALFFLALGYRWYSRYLSKYIYRTIDDDRPAPAVELNDGVDFVPTKRSILFGHHFSSIAGAAPILGPAIAVIWGWLPALLWIVLGAVFMGAVHDYGALVISARHQGRSIGALTGSILGGRAKLLFLSIIFLLVLVVIAVFAYVIAILFVKYPGSVIPINFEIIVAICIGRWSYGARRNLFWPSIIALLLLYVMTYVGYLYPVHLPEAMWINGSEVFTWVLLLLGYGLIAAVLPVWVLLQPRDYINSHQLVVGLLIIYLSIFIACPEMDAPAVRIEGASVSWFPFLFVTIACGAISGFHALVSSGTTSKQLLSMRDARAIGYGSMIGEATLAVAATIAVAAGFPSAEAWTHHYADFHAAGGLQSKLSAFVNGTSGFITDSASSLGLHLTSVDLGQLAAVLISVLVISFAATSLDTAVRIQRYIIGEFLSMGPIERKWTQNRYLQAGLAVSLSFFLILGDDSGTGGLILWPIFGTTNQLLGALTLLVLSVWLYRSGLNYKVTLIPMVIITTVTAIASGHNLIQYLASEKYLLFSVTAVIAIAQIWVIIEAIKVVRDRNEMVQEDD